MESFDDKIDFDEVAKIVASNLDEHKKVIETSCIKSSIIPLSDYYTALEKEYKDLESSTTPRQEKPDPLEYVSLFEAIEAYPSNLPKPKKQSSRENNRLHTTLKSNKTNSSITNINNSKVLEDQPPASVICNEFFKFTEKLSNYKKEIAEQAGSKEYSEKLDNLNSFAKELDKLSLFDETELDAFTKEEEIKIKKISENMEHYAFIQENQDLYSNLDSNQGNSQKLNDLVDIVTDTLVAVNNSYKPK